MYPRKLFIINLTQFIAEYIDSGRDAIITADANEHVVKVKLAKKMEFKTS